MPGDTAWISDDGLRFEPDGDRWQVSIAREFPMRLGEPEGIELPGEGARVAAGEMLLAIELSKARVEFTAPRALVVCMSHAPARAGGSGTAFADLWTLVIEFEALTIVC